MRTLSVASYPCANGALPRRQATAAGRELSRESARTVRLLVAGLLALWVTVLFFPKRHLIVGFKAVRALMTLCPGRGDFIRRRHSEEIDTPSPPSGVGLLRRRAKGSLAGPSSRWDVMWRSLRKWQPCRDDSIACGYRGPSRTRFHPTRLETRTEESSAYAVSYTHLTLPTT